MVNRMFKFLPCVLAGAGPLGKLSKVQTRWDSVRWQDIERRWNMKGRMRVKAPRYVPLSTSKAISFAWLPVPSFNIATCKPQAPVSKRLQNSIKAKVGKPHKLRVSHFSHECDGFFHCLSNVECTGSVPPKRRSGAVPCDRWILGDFCHGDMICRILSPCYGSLAEVGAQAEEEDELLEREGHGLTGKIRTY